MALMVTRFAPSPTGHLHVGGARTALFCWAFAQKARLQGHDGRFMIRIEDTDQARSSDESARGILDDLAWLGIEWHDGPTLNSADGRAIGGDSRNVGPYFQARRVPIYNAYIEHLVRMGRAYPAFETNEQLDAWRKEAQAKKATFKYPRPTDVKLGEFNADRWARAQKGEPHVIRFLMPPSGILVNDEILGEVKFAAGEVDDFVIRKQDGFPTYHFAVVIDDELMGVTHVLRAQEHLINTPKHVAMQDALTRLNDDRNGASGSSGVKFRRPLFAHMPLIVNMDATKMSKRDKAKAARKAVKDAMAKLGPQADASVAAWAKETGIDEKTLREFIAAENDSLDVAAAIAAKFGVQLPEVEVWDYRKSGYLPSAITNFLSLLGWSPGTKSADGKDIEKFDMAYLAEHFDLARIGKTSAKFDRVKLLSFNGDAIAALSDAEFENRLTSWAREWEPAFADSINGIEAGRRAGLMRMAKPRCKTLRDAMKVLAFALVTDDAMAFDPAAVTKAGLAPGGPGRAVVQDFAAFIQGSPAIEPATIDSWIKQHAESKGMKMGDVAMPIRVALTGTNVSPPLGEVAAALGKASVMKRIGRLN